MSVSLGAKGAIAYWSSGTIDVPYPAGVEAGDLLVLQIGFKEAIGNIRQPRGWSEVAETYTAFGTVGPDTGPSRISTFVKRALGTESGVEGVNLASANASWAQITRWESSTGEFYVETVVGQNAVDDAVFSAELTPIPRISLGWLRPGDVVMVGATANTDTVNWSAHSISSPGLTFGAVTELDEYATTSGNNLGGATWYAHVMSGAQTDRKVTVGATLSANAYGAATLIRIRDSLVMDPDAPTLVGVAAGRNSGSKTIQVGIPIGVKAGDLLLYSFMGSGSEANIAFSDDVAKGWTVIHERVSGTRYNQILGRIYDPATPITDYLLTSAVSVSFGWTGSAWRNHDLTTMEDLIVGTGYNRGSTINYTTVPGITLPKANSVALAFFGEATNALGGWTQTANDFDLLIEKPEQPVSAASIEWVTALCKKFPLGGSTNPVTLTYANAIVNAFGIQVGFARGADNPISTGLIGLHALIGPSSDQVKIGAERLSGNPTDVVVAELWYEGVSKLSEQTMDGDADWLHANFQDVAPDSLWVVKFRVNDVVQTDVQLTGRTLPSWMTPTSFVAVTGSCQVTGSNHMIFDKMAADNPLFFAHMGDLHYEDASDFSEWRAGMESSMKAPRFAALLEKTFFHWSMDNHDRVITNPGGDPALGLNLGATDPRTVTEWRKLAGNQEWATEDTLGRTWVVGRVRFIQTDMWSKRDDPDFVASPRTFLGAAQKQWWKDVMGSATEPLIVWFTQWTGRNNATGRWASFPEETAELEAFVNARPGLKRRMVLIGGDSHSLQADSGTHNALRNASSSYRWRGIPSLNVSGIDKNGGTTGDAGAAGQWDIANAGLRTAEEPANGWGAYSRMTFTDDGLHLRFKWEAVRMDYSGNTSVVAWFERSFGNTMDQVFMGDQQAVEVYQGTDKIWEATEFGASF